MKKYIILIILTLIGYISNAQDPLNKYVIRAYNYLEAKEAFVISNDTVNSTTKLSITDTTLVTLEYLEANYTLPDSVGYPQDFFRSGNLTAIAGDNNVVFDIPFTDANYMVLANTTYTKNRLQQLIVTNRLNTGFTIKDVISESEIDWIAIRRVDSLQLLINNLTEVVKDITGADGLVYSNDTLYLMAADSILSFVEITGGSTQSFKFEKALSLNENNIETGYNITQSTLVFINGYAVINYTYSGTQVTLPNEVLPNDYLVVTNTGDTPLYTQYLNNSEVNISVPFTLTTKSIPFYNGVILHNSQYSGSISLGLDVKQSDNLIIKQ